MAAPAGAWERASPAIRHGLLMIAAAVITPLIIVLHELAHYLAAAAGGVPAHIHYARIALPPGHAAPDILLFLIMVAGPVVDASLALTGFLWLRLRRKSHRVSKATPRDWMATLLAMSAVRWLRCFTGTPSSPQPQDEAMLSTGLGLPAWFLPYAMAPLALAFLTAVVRWHPRNSRALPFACVLAGIVSGRLFWMHFLGPLVLP